jgi:hypothetical protein
MGEFAEPAIGIQQGNGRRLAWVFIYAQEKQ